MSYGTNFQNYVDSLREIGFPVDSVTGGDIHTVFQRGLDIKAAVVQLHRISETRRRAKQSLNRMVK